MSDPSRRFPEPSDPRSEARSANKRSKKHDHASCDRPPSDPDGLVGDYNNDEGERHGRLTLRVKWNEVTTDTLGNPIRLKKYNLEWQNSKDSGASWRDAGRARVPAKQDDDPNDKAHYSIQKIRGRLDYRFRVLAEATGGCQSDWSGWCDVGPAIETPPDVTELTLDVDEHSVHASWVLPDDPDNPDVKDLRIEHEEIELYKGAVDPGNLVTSDRHRVSEHWHYKLTTPPGNATFRIRVRTISASGTRGNWVQTSATKDTPSQPAAPSIAFDAGGARHTKFRALVTIAEVADTDFEIAKYHVQFVDKKTAGTPTSSDDRDHRTVKAKGTNKELEAIFRGIPKDHFTYARTQAVDKDSKESAWSPWAAGGKPSASASVPALTDIGYIENTRRVGIKWKTPMDGNSPTEDIAHVHAQIAYDNGFVSLADEGHHHAGSGTQRYAVPPEELGLTFYARVRPIDGADNAGAWQPSATGHALVPGGDVSGGAHAIGEIWTWSGKAGSIPSTAKICNGQAISRTTYSELNALYAGDGYPYGAGDGSTTFNVPDLRHRHIVGAGDDSQVGANDGTSYPRDERHNTHGNHATHGHHDKHGNHTTHGPHGAHSGHNTHNPHATHGAHGAHGAHGSHRTDNVAEATHNHFIAFHVTKTDVADAGSASGGTGTPVDLTRSGHAHFLGSFFTNSGASHNHTHAVGHDSTSGSQGHTSHTEHGSHTEHASGEHDYSPGSKGHSDHTTHNAHTEHAAGEHDHDGTTGHGDHTEHDNAAGEHDADKPGGKGHNDHPRQHQHHVVQVL